MKTFIALSALVALAVANPLPLVQIIVNVDAPSNGNPVSIIDEEPIVVGPIVLPTPTLPVIDPAPHPVIVVENAPEVVPDPIILPEPVLPELVPEPIVLPEPVLPELLPEPIVLPSPALPEIAPEPIELPEIVPEPIVVPEFVPQPIVSLPYIIPQQVAQPLPAIIN
ncbi:magnetosome-associated protein MamJ-like [Achroia grisella]|uniref:magnetosome-associated protein MamJ-like n=1 Tax=Achroia grisella TaxID=688607 RepID=UPI0027D284EB|nr:magnetosome-associated protein MamJ-like [Achroia grisella]XP_059054394.1 magnetosome-associated protein MamJ-like [Achroia grisella]